MMKKALLGVVAALLLLGGGFYGGRLYQNTVDQSLFTAYNPPQTAAGGSGNGFRGAALGVGGAQSAQVAAALALGSPPVSGSTGGAGASSQTSGGGAVTSQVGATTGQGAATPATGQPTAIRGQWVSAGAATLTVQSFQGQQSIATTAATRYYLLKAATAKELVVGQRVDVAPDPSATATAASVTIAPPGTLFVVARSFGGAGAGSTGGFGTGTAGGGFGSGSAGGAGAGSAGGFGAGGTGTASAGTRVRRGGGTAGTISAVGNGSITLMTSTGSPKTFTMSASTAVFRTVGATSSQFTAGSQTSVWVSTLHGAEVSVAAVQSPVAGTTATFSAPSTGAGTTAVAQAAAGN